jgi:hypothetical protein
MTSWYAAAEAWHSLATRIEAQVVQLDEAAAGLAADWRGEAGDAARGALADLRARAAVLRLPAARTAELLYAHADVLSASPAASAVSDARTAAEIAALSCTSGGSPAAVRVWWDGLSPAQRAWLSTTAPDRIGALDGVPAIDRDRANRELLRRERSRPHSKATQAGLDAIADRLTDGALLLGLDTRGDGKAIVAFGDPDHADNVLTFVPGMHTALDGTLAANLDHTLAMGTAATAADPAKTTSAVLWLGYDAPDGLWEAAQAKYAHAARADLHSFQEGLVATHAGEIGEQSLVGYSYGALVVGETARDTGVNADDLVFLGAPGVGVAHATDLHVDPDTVWAASADNDIVSLAAPSVKQLLLEQVWPRYMGDPMPDLWHGHNPADAGFGGHVFAAGGRSHPIDAHLSYWDTGSPALANVGLIAAGRDGQVAAPLTPP